MFYKEKKGEELIQEAKKLGVYTESIFPSRGSGAGDIANDHLQERVRSAKNTKYAQSTWIIALISALVSLVSAITAWVVVQNGDIKSHIYNRVFDECFDYYVSTQPEKGADMSIVQLCGDKAHEFAEKFKVGEIE